MSPLKTRKLQPPTLSGGLTSAARPSHAMPSRSTSPIPRYSDAEIVAARPQRNRVDPRRPYAFLVEPEHSADGRVEDVATIFLTNRECPFRCLFCDLWKNTTEERVPVGAIPEQIDFALAELTRRPPPTHTSPKRERGNTWRPEPIPSLALRAGVDATPAHHIKLYNSGNFFDRQAVPPEDHAAIADRLSVFRTVIVENHPKLCGDDVPRFRDLLNGDLEVALGLETVHPDILPRLNKRMTLDDYARAADFLLSQRCHVRSFILLRPPFLDERDGIDWALRSLEYAFDRGARCCSVIPARGGNGIMERLEEAGAFSPPRLTSLEVVLEEGLNLKRGRVFVDLWDAERLAACPDCAAERIERLRRMNLTQCLLPRVSCACE